uniref:Uncharacterized protein n=1 Tax=Leersia perrieri TaxID=77586 RepID=A0A0D9WIJ7_9ORYZ
MGSSSSRRWGVVVRVVFLASLLVLASAQQPPPATAEMSGAADVDAILARVCGGGASRPLPLCHELRLRRRRVGAGRHHRRPSPVMMPPPGRDEEVDLRYGVAKRLVPTGPNPLHN